MFLRLDSKPEVEQPPLAEAIYFVDDDRIEVAGLLQTFENLGFNCIYFNSPERFLSEVPKNACGCLVIDQHMPRISGLEVFDEVVRRSLNLTTVLLSGNCDLPECRAAFHKGMFDVVEKSYERDIIEDAIHRAVAQNRKERCKTIAVESHWQRIRALTERELEVAQLLADGKTLKEVGKGLSISAQTASKHRSSIFTKLGVNNEVELHKSIDLCSQLIDQLNR